MAFRGNRRGRFARKRGRRKVDRVVHMSELKKFWNRNVETKYLQGEITPQAIYEAGVVAQLNGVTQGVDYGQRVGDKLRMNWLDLRLQVFNSAQSFNRVRVIVAYFTGTTYHGAPPTVADILATNNASSVGTVDTVISTYAVREWSRYRILYDKVKMVSSNGGIFTAPSNNIAPSVGGPPVAYFRIKLRLKGAIADFVTYGTSTTVDMNKGFLGLFIVSDGVNITPFTQDPYVSAHYTLAYKDA